MTHKEKLQWMMEWAAENGLALELNGEVGFGRECVGFTQRGNYVDVDFGYASDPAGIYMYHSDDYADSESRRAAAEIFRDDRLDPGKDAPDHYHKHDCLAILGRGQKAEKQLYAWTRRLVDEGAFLETIARDRAEYNNPISLVLHGVERTRLTFKKWEDQQKELADLKASV